MIVYMNLRAMETHKVHWTDIRKGDRDTLFRVWTDAHELLWAEKCWSLLDKHGLTSFSNDVSKAMVLVRLMSLAEIYREFCDRAWEERHDCELVVWASDIGLNRFRIAQCVGPAFDESTEDDEDQLFASALMFLADTARREIYRVLIEEFGNESFLFVSLWNTVEFRRQDGEGYPASEAEDSDEEVDAVDTQVAAEDLIQSPLVLDRREPTFDEINWLEDAEDILWDVTTDKMCAFQWVSEGMPRIR